jgi:glycosyltransferase involved in cell wall biosynthesis
MLKNNSSLITMGIPVFNGEKFIETRLDSLLKQSYENFEIIISDNASTDKTESICKKFVKTDNRVIYLRQEKNIGGILNFKFLLNKAKGKYFIWTAVDDILLPTFLENNVKILESQKNIICSTSKIESYGENTDYIDKIPENSLIKRLEKKIRKHFWLIENISYSGSFEKKIRDLLKKRGREQVFSGLFRTDQLKKIFVQDNFHTGFDLALLINALKIGDIHVIDEILALRYDGGDSSGGMINYANQHNMSFLQALFSYIPFTVWFRKNHGTVILLKNLDIFLKWNLYPLFYYCIDLVRVIFNKK